MPGPKHPDKGPIHPGIIEQEEEKRRRKEKREQPTVPLDNPGMPEHDPAEKKRWEEEQEKEKRKKEENPGGVEEIKFI